MTTTVNVAVCSRDTCFFNSLLPNDIYTIDGQSTHTIESDQAILKLFPSASMQALFESMLVPAHRHLSFRSPCFLDTHPVALVSTYPAAGSDHWQPHMSKWNIHSHPPVCECLMAARLKRVTSLFRGVMRADCCSNCWMVYWTFLSVAILSNSAWQALFYSTDPL